MFQFVKSAISKIRVPQRYSVFSLRCAQTAVAPRLDREPVPIQTFQEQRVEIKTCGSLYKEWKKQALYPSVPDGDLQFTVRYIDTSKDHPAITKDAPTILALHGAPGSYQDFSRLTSFLSERRIRVIAPSFPEFSQYPPGTFRHSASEKAQFLEDFLKAIDVSYFDLLVCHSSAVYPGLKMCVKNTKPTISGLALFNPGPFYTTVRAMHPWVLTSNIVKLSEYPLGMKLLEMLGPSLFSVGKTIRVRIDNPLDPLLSATVMVNAGIKESRAFYYQLASRKFPIFMVFAEDDKLMDKELSYKISYALNVQDPHIFHYDENAVLDKKGRVINNTKVIAFEKGSHYTFSKHSEIVHEELLDFLNKYIL